MSALVKLLGKSALRLRLNLTEETTQTSTQSKLGVELRGGKVIRMSGDSAGTVIEDGIIKAGQRVCISMGEMEPMKYHALVDVNPELHYYGSVGSVHVGEPEELAELSVFFKADKQLDLADLPWIMRIYLID